MTIKQKYTLYGVLFGCSFPIFALLIQISVGGLSFNWKGIVEAHHQNVLIYMIDSAPVFLGLFALIGGVSKAKAENLLSEFKLLAEILKESNSYFSNNSESIFSELLDSTNDINDLTFKLVEANDSLFSNISNNKHKADNLNESTSSLLSSTSDLITLNRNLKLSNDKVVLEVKEFNALVKLLSVNLKKINDIGSEIKTLSINSSIEAYKYGDKAKGFSVIAKQIKMLSENIETLNRNTQGIAKSLDSQIELLNNQINQQNTDLNEVLGLISKIETNTTENKEDVNEIHRNIQNSLKIQETQRVQFSKVSEEVDHLSHEKLQVIENLKSILDDNTSLISRISNL